MAFENVPVPDEVQVPPVATVTTPASVTTELLAQTDWSAPAFTVGAGVIVMVMLADTTPQFPFPVVVNVSVLEPAAISAADGV